MWIKVQAYTPHGTGEDPREPGDIVNIREATALQWIKNGWATARPDLEEKKPEVEIKAKAEVIETPESKRPGLETASLKHKKK
jgi:hypothetical protein